MWIFIFLLAITIAIVVAISFIYVKKFRKRAIAEIEGKRAWLRNFEELAFQITTNSNEWNSVIDDLDGDFVTKLLMNLKENDFIGIESSQLFDNCIFLEVNFQEGTYLVETCFETNSDYDEYENFTLETTRLEEVIKIFNSFYVKHRAPNVVYWNKSIAN
ncbi:MAG: hypothetical protein K0R18_1468 [Bacillales bacterium]|jgi:hypothetical protein|nr:hypothetical protein [Bacillales bacterium]